MQPVYSHLFINTGNLTTGTVDYVVPAGKTAVVKAVTLYKGVAATPVVVYALIFAPGGTPASTFMIGNFSSTTVLEASTIYTGVVAPAGYTLRLGRASAAGTWAGTMSGYLLTS